MDPQEDQAPEWSAPAIGPSRPWWSFTSNESQQNPLLRISPRTSNTGLQDLQSVTDDGMRSPSPHGELVRLPHTDAGFTGREAPQDGRR